MASKPENKWTFFSNHSHVIMLLAQTPELTLREVAQTVGITERAVQRIVAELEEDGYLSRQRVGRQNHYEIQLQRHLRHPVEGHCTLGDLIQLVRSIKLAPEA